MNDKGYWYPFRDSRSIQELTAKAEAEERGRCEWLEDVKRRLGIRCLGDEGRVPEWPVVDVPPGSAYTVVADQAMASYDGVHWLVKPESMTSAEFFASLPKRPC